MEDREPGKTQSTTTTTNVLKLSTAAGLAAVALVAVSGCTRMKSAWSALTNNGKTAPTTYSNSAIVAEPVLKPLTDIFALPTWLPFHNVFSVGDVLIAVGVVVVIVAAMRRPVAELQTTWFV